MNVMATVFGVAKMLLVNYIERGHTMMEMCADYLKQLRDNIGYMRQGVGS